MPAASSRLDILKTHAKRQTERVKTICFCDFSLFLIWIIRLNNSYFFCTSIHISVPWKCFSSTFGKAQINAREITIAKNNSIKETVNILLITFGKFERYPWRILKYQYVVSAIYKMFVTDFIKNAFGFYLVLDRFLKACIPKFGGNSDLYNYLLTNLS